jgi:SAM-dependent methyltransferase
MSTYREISRNAYDLLNRWNLQRNKYTIYEEYFDIRVAEFLLLLRKLEPHTGLYFPHILEVGCGFGCGPLLWKLTADDVVGIDLEPEIQRARTFIEAFKPDDGSITLIASRAEQLTDDLGYFDLIVTSYVLEHLDDMSLALKNVKKHVRRPNGIVVHVLNSLADRLDWYVSYRIVNSIWNQIRESIRTNGVLFALRNPLSYTPPHEVKFGDFPRELGQYRLERWAHKLMLEGYEIIDWFQTRDVNWVFITRPID